jgi:hypothetical protein
MSPLRACGSRGHIASVVRSYCPPYTSFVRKSHTTVSFEPEPLYGTIIAVPEVPDLLL